LPRVKQKGGIDQERKDTKEGHWKRSMLKRFKAGEHSGPQRIKFAELDMRKGKGLRRRKALEGGRRSKNGARGPCSKKPGGRKNWGLSKGKKTRVNLTASGTAASVFA